MQNKIKIKSIVWSKPIHKIIFNNTNLILTKIIPSASKEDAHKVRYRRTRFTSTGQGLRDLVQVVDEVVGEQLQVRRRLGERDAPRSEGPASAQGHGPLHGLRPQGRQIALRERLSEAHGEVFRAQAEQG